jgi:hypothetical protein
VSDWHPIASAPFGIDLELSVIERSEAHALLFPCRRALHGWINAATKSTVQVAPTHWREWDRRSTAQPVTRRR